jgi:hypothetical protein
MSRQERHGVRLKTHFETLYCSDRQEGEAVLADVSYSGALLQSATRPSIGSSIRLYVRLPDGAKPLELRGKVVRPTSDGFAIRYDEPNPEVVRLVDDAAAIASLIGEDAGGSSLIVDVLESASTRKLERTAGLVEEVVVGVPVEDVPVDDIRFEDFQDDDLPLVEVPGEAEATADVEVALVTEVPVGAPMLLSELDLRPYSISEIEALAQRIPEMIAIKRAEAKQRVLRKIEKLAEQEGFSLEELFEKS